jgi:hypothetical protein
MPGTPVYLDNMLPHIYFSLKQEGKIADTFCGEDKNLDEFISYFHRIKTAQVLCRVGPELKLDPVGISWVDLPRGVDGARAAQIGMAFFGDVTRYWDARCLGCLGLAYMFIDLEINVLHGIQLVSNYRARNFAKKLFFREVATVPAWHYVDGQLEDARVMMLRRGEFLPGFEDWFAKQEPAIKNP